MKRYYYSYYADHGLRFYCKFPGWSKEFETASEELNWYAAKYCLENSTPFEKEILMRVYASPKPLKESVKDACKETKLSTECIFNMVETIRKNFAKRRGIL